MFVVGVMFASADAHAEDDLELLSLEQLLEVDVSTASYILEERTAQPVSMTTISREEIEASGARTLSELLNSTVPGYFLVEDQDDTIAGFRGFAPDNNSKVLLLVDGRSLNTEWFWGPPDAILNGIDLGWIERIEVIRGPGSVTHGQGALLGVINVITTRPDDAPSARLSTRMGTHGLIEGSLEARFSSGDVSGSFYLGGVDFTGSPLRDAGWAAAQENPPGTSVYDRGHRLKAAGQSVTLANLGWRELALQVLVVDQWRDNYNFYRDREAITQRLLAVTATHRIVPRAGLEISTRVGYDRDEIGQMSLGGLSLAGTREDRASALVVATGTGWMGDDRAALGAELEHVEMGLADRHGQNLIVNDVADRPGADNRSHTYVERDSVTSAALLGEYARTIGRVTGFAGLRLDAHPKWGAAWTPRLGALVDATRTLDLRIALHSGFRGAVGVHYTGGWRRDGLLSEANFDAVDDNPLLDSLGYQDLAPTSPERMFSGELAARYQPTSRLTIEGVGFVNRVDHIIDVGVLFVGDPIEGAPPEQRRIGDDVVGDWGGWFFFKNNPGTIVSGGAELAATWRSRWLDVRGSHSLARILALGAGASQVGSMYVSGTDGDPHFRAYPENVARLATRVRPSRRTWIAGSLVWFSRWYTPAGGSSEADGSDGAWLDLSAGIRLPPGFAVSATIKNVTDAQGLWPMNSNASDPRLSPGTPALEPRSVWVTFAMDVDALGL